MQPMSETSGVKWTKLSKAEKKAFDTKKKGLAAQRRALFRAIQDDNTFCYILTRAVIVGRKADCSRWIAYRYRATGLFEGEAGARSMHDLLSWAGTVEDGELNPHIAKLMQTRAAQKAKHHSAKRRIVSVAGLNPAAVNKDEFYSKIPEITVNLLDTPFPPPYLYVSESGEIYEKNMEFVLERDLPDDRKWRKLIFELEDPALLSYDLPPSESAVFKDADGNVVGVVIRNACGHKDVLNFIDSSVKDVIDTRTDIRQEDGGHISQMGLSAGSLSHSLLGWVRNIRRDKNNTSRHQQINTDASSAFAVLWNLARALLLPEIVNDFDTWLKKIGPKYRMDGDGTMGTGDGLGKYHIKMGEGKPWYEFNNAHLAPPAGVMAENYCRFTHFEHQPHRWAVSLTTSRTFDDRLPEANRGGNFFISSYGIRIQAAPNTLIAWRPTDWHGTSLYHINPFQKTGAEYHQRGLAFVTGNRLANAMANAEDIFQDEDFVHAEPHEKAEQDAETFVTELRRSKRLQAMAAAELKHKVDKYIAEFSSVV